MRFINTLFRFFFLSACFFSHFFSFAQVISAGQAHSLGRAWGSGGQAWAWGDNASGPLGDNTTTQRNTPVQVLGGGTGGTYLINITALSAGNGTSLALRNDGTVWGWGDANNGKLGINNQTDSHTPIQVLAGAAGGTYLTGITAMAAANVHSIALRNDGTVWTWGGGSLGELGNNTTTAAQLTPVQVLGGAQGGTYLTGISAISGGSSHSMALRGSDGTVWTWGSNGGAGKLGDNTTTQRNTPVQVVGGAQGGAYLTGISAVSASNFGNFCMALRNDGTVWIWGDNTNGQLGINNTTTSITPVQVVGGAQGGAYLTGITAVSAGGNHAVALASDGTAWSWGRNERGQCSDNTQTERDAPIHMLNSGGTTLTGILSVSAGDRFTLFQVTGGNILGVGFNNKGGLGDGTTGNQPNLPVSQASSGLSGNVVPLPVEMLSFNASLEENNSVQLFWSSASEMNSDHFEVERSRDGVNFISVGVVQGAGTSDVIHNYKFTDEDPFFTGRTAGGEVFYRLKQFDYNGRYNYFGPVVVKPGSGNGVWQYPNPSNGNFYLSFDNSFAMNGKEMLIVVRDMLGREFYSKVFYKNNDEQIIAIDPSCRLASGVYTVVATSDNNIYMKKIMIY